MFIVYRANIYHNLIRMWSEL
ncbi:hypothetical protein VQX02_003771 [Acinetobacter baumannii]|nr:hypothetical protein [Acinetobacter baumannii]